MTGKLVVDTHFQPMRFGSYLLLDRINVGGMAEVFRAKSYGMAGVERLVAIKRILPHLAQDPDFTNMFIDEARIAIHLRHSNIAQIYELNEIGQSLFIAMEYVQGRDLRALINRMRFLSQPIPLPLVVYIISKVCEGLDYAHRKCDDLSRRELHIVHRDVSPQNVILSYEGEVKIIDFGIAKASAKRTHTQAGILKGKFGYMAPEQVMGQDIDRRTDIFCTGILTYELLTRERLFAGSNELSTLRRIRQREMIPPTILNPNVPKPIEDMVLKALALDPRDRFSYASDYGEALLRALIECGEEPYTSRHMRNFMHDVFGKDLNEDLQRLEAVLQRADELEKSGIWGALLEPVVLPPPPESMTEGTHEQTNPSWHSDSIASVLGQSEPRELYQDTPSPFAEKQPTSSKTNEEIHRTFSTMAPESPVPGSPSVRGEDRTSLPIPPTAPKAPAASYSTLEVDFAEEWEHDPDFAEQKTLLPELPMPSSRSNPSLLARMESVEQPQIPAKPLTAHDNTKNIRPPAAKEKSLLVSGEQVVAQLQGPPPFFRSSGEISAPADTGDSLYSYISPTSVSHSQPGLVKPKKSHAVLWLMMWGFLCISLAVMLYFLLVVPAPQPIPSLTDASDSPSLENRNVSIFPRTQPSRLSDPKSDSPSRRTAAVDSSTEEAIKTRRTLPLASEPAKSSQTPSTVLPRVTELRPNPFVVKPTPTGAAGRLVRLRVVSKPAGAALWINGVSKGETPLDVSLPQSSTPYQVELRKAGYRTFRVTWVSPPDGTPQQVSWTLRAASVARKGYVTITSTPRAIIYINGITTEKKELQRHPLPPGKYQISFVTKDGEVWDADLQVHPGKEATLHSQHKKK